MGHRFSFSDLINQVFPSSDIRQNTKRPKLPKLNLGPKAKVANFIFPILPSFIQAGSFMSAQGPSKAYYHHGQAGL